MAAQFTDKVVIITGGNSGIGAACVASFRASGAIVIIFDIADAPEGKALPKRFNYKCNVASEESVNEAVKDVVDMFGRIDVLVNCAGVMDNCSGPRDTTTAHWDKVLSINLNGPFYTTRAVLPHMLANETSAAADAPPSFTPLGEPRPPIPPSKGVIINICSVASIGGGSAGTPYTVSKHGLLGLTRTTAWMHKDDGIRCNAVLPGGMATNIYANSKVEMNMEGMGKLSSYQSLMGVVRTPDVVANAVLWLAGSEGVNGAEIKVDGGWTTC